MQSDTEGGGKQTDTDQCVQVAVTAGLSPVQVMLPLHHSKPLEISLPRGKTTECRIDFSFCFILFRQGLAI